MYVQKVYHTSSFTNCFKVAIIGVHSDPDLYGLHSPKVGAVVALANGGADLRDVVARVGFAPNSGSVLQEVAETKRRFR